MKVGFSDLVLGTVYQTTARTVSVDDIMRFAGLTGDLNPLHVDEEWVRNNTAYRERIAHGLLITSIGAGLHGTEVDDWNIQAFLSVQRDMKAPVYPDDTIRQVMTINQLRPSRSAEGRGIVTLAVSVVNQNGDEVQNGVDVLLVGGGGQ
ncbi:MaoC family dehydratase [Arthrobacter sp. 2MCAF15]|uniref:MaoC family dehydratase n=1 Tax=Arthrobacter sp. 2MCAF15 TaxID=3232984 RepID=UPI003F8E8FDD